MGYMEIALLQKSALKIKGKYASFVVNPADVTSANAVLFLHPDAAYQSDEAVVLSGAGEYEIGGVKITGQRNDKGVLYSLKIDGMEVLVGSISVLSSMHQKLKEHNQVIVLCNEVADASYLTALAINAVVFYGDHAQEVAQSFEKEKLQQMNKYTTSLGKLPAEMETILLS